MEGIPLVVDPLGTLIDWSISMNLESPVTRFSELEPEEPIANALRAAGHPPASVVFGLFVVLSVFGSAAYILCFYLK
jgi:hypothetical protein